MENKFIRLLKTLTVKEFRDFGKFLKSPIFNDSNNYVRFYEYLSKYYPDFGNEGITKEKLYSAFYSGMKYEDKKLRDRLRHSLELLKKFIAFNHFQNNEFEYVKNCLSGLKNKDVKNIFEEEYIYANSLLTSTVIKDEEFYYRNYWLSSLFREYIEIRTPVNEKLRVHGKALNEVDNIISFFLIVMMKEYSKMFNIQREIKFDYKFKFYEEIISFISKEEDTFVKVPLVNLLYRFISLYNFEGDEKYIRELNNSLKNNKNSISKEIFKTFCIELYNYCKRMQSKGHTEFGRLSFELMSDYLKEGIFLENDMLSAHAYINLAATAIRENEMIWAEKFVNENKQFVIAEERENAYNYNYAVLFYMQGYSKEQQTKIKLYSIALDYLAKVKSDDFYYMTRIKNHELKIYYELDHIDNLLSLIDSYYHYLTRSKLIPIYLKESYLNFVKYIEKLTRLKLKKGSLSKEQLRKLIETNNNIEYKGWLLQRLQELV